MFPRISLEVALDPFVLFCAVCLVTPPIAEFGNLTADMLLRYVTHPSILFVLAILAFTVWETYNGKLVSLSSGERMRARWYLLNGVFIHILMDGMVGVFKVEPLFAKNYNKLDRRYGSDIGTFQGSAVHIISLMELFVKGPLCLLLYRAYHRGSAYRDVLEFFTCVTQAYGTVVYLGQEAISGAQNFDVDYNLSFTVHYLIYFWFAVFIGCVLYLIVPSYLGFVCLKRMVNAQHEYDTRHPLQLRKSLPPSASSLTNATRPSPKGRAASKRRH